MDMDRGERLFSAGCCCFFWLAREETKIREAERARDWSAPRTADAVRLL